MNPLRSILVLGLCACAVQAAEPPAAAEAPNSIKIFRGQWNFLASTTAWCAEGVPAMKKSLDNARDNGEEQMEQAEAIVLDETADNREGYKTLYDQYASTWVKYAAELVAAIKKQDPKKACPDLLSNWQSADADLILEDWHGFVERSGPVRKVEAAKEDPHGAGK